MQLRHISPRSSDWVDAMEGGGSRGWDKLAPEELTKLRQGAEAMAAGSSSEAGAEADDYGWGAEAASR
jgi:hypothetical protein